MFNYMEQEESLLSYTEIQSQRSVTAMYIKLDAVMSSSRNCTCEVCLGKV